MEDLIIDIKTTDVKQNQIKQKQKAKVVQSIRA